MEIATILAKPHHKTAVLYALERLPEEVNGSALARLAGQGRGILVSPTKKGKLAAKKVSGVRLPRRH